MGGIADFVKSVVSAPERLGDALLAGAKPKKPKTLQQQQQTLQKKTTTQFFDPDRGARVAAARKAAGASKGSLKQQFRLDLVDAGSDDDGRQTRSGLTIG